MGYSPVAADFMRVMRIVARIVAAMVLVKGCFVGAETLIGTQVAGGLYFPGYPMNYFDPANGLVPAGYLNFAGNTVTISSNAVEFGYNDGTATITADFTGTQLVFTDTPTITAHYNAIQAVFTNTNSAFNSLSKASDNFPSGGMTGSSSGDVILLNWAGGDVVNGERLQAVFDVNAPAAPTLNIQLTSTNAVVIFWPGPSTDFHLQQNSDLNSTNWVEVTSTFTNGQNQVVVSPPVGTRFYRLKYP